MRTEVKLYFLSQPQLLTMSSQKSDGQNLVGHKLDWSSSTVETRYRIAVQSGPSRNTDHL